MYDLWLSIQKEKNSAPLIVSVFVTHYLVNPSNAFVFGTIPKFNECIG